jgi:hypothetical protein
MSDSEGRIVLINQEIERIFGYSREELLGQSIDRLVPERFRGPHAHRRREFMESPRLRPMGARRYLDGLRKDGSEVPVEIGLTPVVTEEGVFVLSAIVDITARKRAEELFRAALESSPAGKLVIDAAGRVVLVNREVERLFGYAREELLGRPVDMLVPPRFRDAHPGYRDAFFADPEARPMGAGRELYGLRKDGSEVPIEIGLTPIETDDGSMVLSSIVDISARKQSERYRLELEEQLRQAQRLDALGTLAGGIAHDFNNILGALVGYTELAREGSDDEAVIADLDEVLRAAFRGKELVQRILSFSRRQETQRRPTDLAPVVSEASQLLRASLPAGIDMRLQIGSALPQVLADATSVHQVLMNLGTNAAHAMPEGGTLAIALASFYARDSFIRVHTEMKEGPYVLLTVSDTGTGMDAAIRDRAFEPFFTTKGAGVGSGLGLAVVHGILRDHSGTALIDSEVGEGTRVRCFFPALDVEPAVLAHELAADPRGSGEHILYVDDQRALVEGGRRRLETLGYRVTGAIGARAAIDIFRAAPADFDLVITDYSMPAMSGVELAQQLAALRSDVSIILLTGYVQQLPEGQLRAARIVRVLKKPITSAELGSAVRDVLGVRKADRAE